MSECNHSPTVQLWALMNDNKCPVCLAARLAEAERDAEKWRKAQDMALLIYDKHLRGVTQSFLRTVNEYVDGIRATDSAEHRETETHG